MKERQMVKTLTCSVPLVLSLLAAHGCGNASQSSASSARQLIVAIDVSDRNPERMLAYSGIAYRFQRGLRPVDTVRIYEFAHAPQLMYEGPPIRGRGMFNRKVAARFASEGAAMCQMGTRTHLTLDKVFADARRHPYELSVVVLTDGGIEELGSQVMGSIHTSIRDASLQPRLRHLLVAGVNEEWRSQWEQWAAPLGDTATIRGLNDLDSFSADDLWARSR